MHRRIQYCHLCRTSCDKKSTMSVHLREHYGNSIPQLRFDALLDLCDRAMPDTEHKGEHCRFCGEVISLSEAQHHLGRHMETLALFVLSSNDDIEEEVVSGNPIQAESSDSESGTKDRISEKSSLGISATGSLKINIPFSTNPIFAARKENALAYATQSVEGIRRTIGPEESSAMTKVDTAGPPKEDQTKSINRASQIHHVPSSTYGSTRTPSFAFRIEEIAEHPHIAPRTTETGSWKPPLIPGGSYSLGTGTSNLYGCCNGHQISWLPRLPHGNRVYKQYSTYYAEGSGFWILKGDGRAPPPDEDWHKLRFDTHDNRGSSYLTNAGQLSTLHVQPYAGGWAHMLLPDIYHSRTPATRECPGGLTGELPIFLALVAFTTTAENLQGVLPYTFSGGRWGVHNWQAPRRSPDNPQNSSRS
jgi:hypothetical protein